MRAAPDEYWPELLWRRAVQAIAILLRRHLRDDWQVAHPADRGDGSTKFIQVPERFQHEQVDAAFGQCLRLFLKPAFGFIDAGLAPRLDSNTQWANRPRYKSGAAPVPAVSSGRVARDPCAFEVDGLHLLAQPERTQLDAIGPERVGFENVGAGSQVFAVHALDQRWIGQVQRFEASIEENTLRVQEGAHRTVTHEHAVV